MSSNVTYELEEDAGEGYSATYAVTSNMGAETEYGSGRKVERTIRGDFGSETVTVTNSKYELEIGKTVEGEATEDSFEFNARFTYHGEGYELEHEPEGWEKQEDGSYRFTLKANEKVKVIVAEGVEYEVSEGYRADYESSGAESGTMTSDKSASFVNVRKYRLSISKSVEGSAAAKAADYSFRISFTRDGAAYDPADVPETWEKEESGSYIFTLSDGGSESVYVHSGVSYRVSETTEGSYTEYTAANAAGNIASGVGRTVEGEVTSEDVSESVSFVNREFGTLTIIKEVTGKLGTGGRFAFELRLTGYELERLPEGWTQNVDGTYSFSLEHGESVSVTIPVGIRFELTEEEVGNYITTVAMNGDEIEGRKVEGSLTGDAIEVAVSYVNDGQPAVPTGADIPFGGAMLTLPLFGLAMYLIIKRRKREEQ